MSITAGSIGDAMGRGARAVHQAGDKSSMFNPFSRFIFFNFMETPLLQVYLFGPSLGGYGFWQGAELQDICTQLTSVPGRHWDENIDECAALVYNRFEGYLVVFYVVIYIYTIAVVAHGLFSKCLSALPDGKECCTRTLKLDAVT